MTINKKSFMQVLNKFQEINLDSLMNSRLRGHFREEYFALGFAFCISSLKDFYNIEKNDIDNYLNIMYK